MNVFAKLVRKSVCTRTLAEKNAKSPEEFGDLRNVIDQQDEVRRCWKLRTKLFIRMYLNYLTEYTAAKNKQAQRYVSGPMVDGVEMDGDYRQLQVQCVAGRDGKPRIVQTLRRVHTLTEIKDLKELKERARSTRKNEILEVFNLQTGEGDTKAWVFPDINPTAEDVCFAFSDAELVTNVSGAGWTYVDRDFREVPGQNVAEFVALFRKIVWQTWGHDSYAADITEHSQNAGTANELEVIRKTWVNIRNADMTTAEGKCRTGTNVAAESGYIIFAVHVSNNKTGSFDITQYQKKQINNVDENGAIQLAPHALHSGTATLVITVYKNFTSATLPADDSVTAGGDVISNIPKIQPDGFWQRTVITKAVTWTKTWSDKIKMSEHSVAGHGLREFNEATGIPEANRAAAFTAAQSASAATRNVLMTKLMERAHGERVIQQMEGRLYEETTEADAVVLQVQASVGSKQAYAVRVWWRRTAAAWATLVGGGAAASNMTTNPGAYTHSKYYINDHGDGAYSVFQIGVVVDAGKWSKIYDEESERLMLLQEHIFRTSSGIEAYERQLLATYRTIYDTAAGAAAYADDSSTIFEQATGEEIGLGLVKYVGSDKWAGYKKIKGNVAVPWVIPT